MLKLFIQKRREVRLWRQRQNLSLSKRWKMPTMLRMSTDDYQNSSDYNADTAQSVTAHWSQSKSTARICGPAQSAIAGTSPPLSNTPLKTLLRSRVLATNIIQNHKLDYTLPYNP